MMKDAFRLQLQDVQGYLQENGIDGWLLYDFGGMNKVALDVIAFPDHFFSRRWYYFIPQKGTPLALVHRIEDVIFPSLPGERRLYAGWQEVQTLLRETLAGKKKIAMEYSPRNAIPTVSYVDAGTIEMIREIGVEIVSSANLVQYFTCRLSEVQLDSHKRAVQILYTTQEKAFRLIEEALQSERAITELDVQQFIAAQIEDHGLVTMSHAIVAVNGNASNPHYAPTADRQSPICRGDCILIDLWAKENTPDAVYGDITWVGFAGKQPPAEYVKIFTIARDARDRAVAFLQKKHAKGQTVMGYQVDEVVRQYIADHGYGEAFFHRTGHSIGQSDHGKGVNIDSFETVDLREIVPGLLFSIEPGIYLPDFGVRTEIDVYYSQDGPHVFTPMQTELILLDV